MDKHELLMLERPVYESDGLGQKIQTGVQTRTVYCGEKSITRAEWAAAAQNRLKAAYCLTVWADEYEGETVAIYGGVRYGIYRTYRKGSDEIELYLEQKAGV